MINRHFPPPGPPFPSPLRRTEALLQRVPSRTTSFACFNLTFITIYEDDVSQSVSTRSPVSLAHASSGPSEEEAMGEPPSSRSAAAAGWRVSVASPRLASPARPPLISWPSTKRPLRRLGQAQRHGRGKNGRAVVLTAAGQAVPPPPRLLDCHSEAPGCCSLN